MNKLSLDDVKRVASLAKLTLTQNEIKKFQSQLSKVISHIDELNEVNTQGVQPTSQTTGLTNVTRPDQTEVFESLSQEEALSGAKTKHNGFFVTQAIFEK